MVGSVEGFGDDAPNSHRGGACGATIGSRPGCGTTFRGSSTHASTTDPEARRVRTGKGHERHARLPRACAHGESRRRGRRGRRDSRRRLRRARCRAGEVGPVATTLSQFPVLSTMAWTTDRVVTATRPCGLCRTAGPSCNAHPPRSICEPPRGRDPATAHASLMRKDEPAHSA